MTLIGRPAATTPRNSQAQWAAPAADRSTERLPVSRSVIERARLSAFDLRHVPVAQEPQARAQTAATAADPCHPSDRRGSAASRVAHSYTKAPCEAECLARQAESSVQAELSAQAVAASENWAAGIRAGPPAAAFLVAAPGRLERPLCAERRWGQRAASDHQQAHSAAELCGLPVLPAEARREKRPLATEPAAPPVFQAPPAPWFPAASDANACRNNHTSAGLRNTARRRSRAAARADRSPPELPPSSGTSTRETLQLQLSE
jgi:hypothetical protein